MKLFPHPPEVKKLKKRKKIKGTEVLVIGEKGYNTDIMIRTRKKGTEQKDEINEKIRKTENLTHMTFMQTLADPGEILCFDQSRSHICPHIYRLVDRSAVGPTSRRKSQFSTGDPGRRSTSSI